MFRDVGDFFADVFKSWWARIGILNGVVSYGSRVVGLGPINPYIATVFIWAGMICLGISLLCVYTEQKKQIRLLHGLLNHRGEMTTILIDKLRREVLNNIEHLGDFEMLHDDAWRAIQPEHLRHLPRELRNLGSEFYTDLRSWQNMLDTPDHRESAMRKRQEFRKELGVKGKKLYDEILKVQALADSK